MNEATIEGRVIEVGYIPPIYDRTKVLIQLDQCAVTAVLPKDAVSPQLGTGIRIAGRLCGGSRIMVADEGGEDVSDDDSEK